eukprot:CAMPEP_0113909006 /NCGR_PEP_ID=MMETSP0780_2-20120614/26541_1 /TAXON_ID=652834 /ORGANISM="Palpitomonas bilix" /LENGTH=58 /DNA_ID=CAMNT_0000904625 /DNA_START=47 /DNA_END=223 /DNA_ORIENTATION=+ /assembly_acc=CAM_ASM_000599
MPTPSWEMKRSSLCVNVAHAYLPSSGRIVSSSHRDDVELKVWRWAEYDVSMQKAGRDG